MDIAQHGEHAVMLWTCHGSQALASLQQQGSHGKPAATSSLAMTFLIIEFMWL
jgi:hypothetical protein